MSEIGRGLPWFKGSVDPSYQTGRPAPRHLACPQEMKIRGSLLRNLGTGQLSEVGPGLLLQRWAGTNCSNPGSNWADASTFNLSLRISGGAY
jgi:hypothetical protein